jgi:DNA repair exonuclease SbcCD ATPase subunit
VAAAFDDSLSAQLSALKALGEKLVEEHNQVVETFVARYTEQAFQELEAAVEPLRDALTALESLCEERQQTLESRCSELSEKLTTVAGLLERVRPALQLAGRLR